MYLVGDIGGTNCRLGWARRDGASFEVFDVSVYPSGGFPGLEPILELFLKEHRGALDGVGLGVPGPVRDRRVRTTNIPWEIEAAQLERDLQVPVALCNDLEAAAHGILVLPEGGTFDLQRGEEVVGNRAIVAAGTGLGQAALIAHEGTWIPCASEGGHTDFGPKNDEEIDLLRFARARFGHVSYERIVSGPGLALLYEFYRERLGVGGPLPWQAGEDRAAAVATTAARGTDPAATFAVERFGSIYGSEAGNAALKWLAHGGVYLAGGIAPKLLEALRKGSFLDGFLDKGRYRDLLSRMPVRVVLDPLVGLRGAARAAEIRVEGAVG